MTVVYVVYVVPLKSPLSLCTTQILSTTVDRTFVGFITYRSNREGFKNLKVGKITQRSNDTQWSDYCFFLPWKILEF